MVQWLFEIWWLIAAFLLGWLFCHALHRYVDAKAVRAAMPRQENGDSAGEPAVKLPTSEASNLPLLRLIRSPKSPLPADGSWQNFPEVDSAAALKAGFIIRDKTDLEVIEGIGPRICALLHEAGYPTLGALSTATIHDLYKVLHNASANYKFVKPDTWAQQANLAASNKWYELKGLQDHLILGVSTQIRELNTF